MISRVYTILMPSNAAVNATVDIPVEGTAAWGAVSLTTGPVVAAGADGFYVEQRNRRVRVPVKAGAAATVAAGFVPRFRLGFTLSAQQLTGTGAANLLVISCSRSLVGDVFSTTASGTTPGDGTLQDPSSAPVLRLFNTAAVQGLRFRVFLQIMEAKDEDRDGQVG